MNSFGRLLLVAACWPTLAFAGEGATADLPPGVRLLNHPDLGMVLTDDKGMVLYSPAPSARYACPAFCQQEWPPLLAAEAGARQISYKGVPLYRYAHDDAPGATKGEGLSRHYGERWVAVRYVPDAPVYAAPGGVTVTWVKDAYVFSDAAGRPLRVFKSDPACAGACQPGLTPMKAPLAAAGLGEWRPAADPSGARRWTYKGQTVYVVDGSAAPFDADWRLLKAGS